MRRNHNRILLGVLAVLVVLLATAQLFLPGYAADKIESRLTRNGGEAEATVRSLPAVRLFAGSGDRLSVNATGIELDIETARDKPFERLDGFGDVDLEVRDSRGGPLRIDAMELVRQGSAPYSFEWHGSFSLTDVAAFGAGQFGPFGAIAGGIAAGSVPNANRRLPIDVDMELRSEDGRLRVVSGGGTIAGIPTGPLAVLLTNAIAVQL